MIKVVIGTEASQYIPQRVLQYSIERGTPGVEVYVRTQAEKRLGGTKFGFVRFHVPSMFGFQGKAIYLDADQIVLTDLNELAHLLDDNHKLALVCHPEGFFGHSPVPQRLETSVMVLNCSQLQNWQPETLFNRVVPNGALLQTDQIHYRDFMWLTWMDKSDILCLDPAWNHFNILKDNTKLLHFSHVSSQPWKNPRHQLTEFWSHWLAQAMAAGYVNRLDLLQAILKRHIHPYFLRFVFGKNHNAFHAKALANLDGMGEKTERQDKFDRK
jgi:lipopolysaccharide biosynthesis glycosyltransferase